MPGRTLYWPGKLTHKYSGLSWVAPPWSDRAVDLMTFTSRSLPVKQQLKRLWMVNIRKDWILWSRHQGTLCHQSLSIDFSTVGKNSFSPQVSSFVPVGWGRGLSPSILRLNPKTFLTCNHQFVILFGVVYFRTGPWSIKQFERFDSSPVIQFGLDIALLGLEENFSPCVSLLSKFLTNFSSF